MLKKNISPIKLLLKYITYNSHGQNGERRVYSQQKMSKRDLKSTSGESCSLKAEHFIPGVHKSFPYSTSQCGSTISKTSKGSLEKESSVISR